MFVGYDYVFIRALFLWRLINNLQIMGLENSKVFTLLMITGALSISGLLAIVTHVRGSVETWHSDEKMPKGITGVKFIIS